MAGMSRPKSIFGRELRHSPQSHHVRSRKTELLETICSLPKPICGKALQMKAKHDKFETPPLWIRIMLETSPLMQCYQQKCCHGDRALSCCSLLILLWWIGSGHSCFRQLHGTSPGNGLQYGTSTRNPKPSALIEPKGGISAPTSADCRHR